MTPGPGIYFNAYIHIYSPRAEADKPLGPNVDVKRKPLSLCPLLQVLKQSLWRMILNTFKWLYTRIQPQCRDRQPLGDKMFMLTEIPYHFHLLPVLKNLFEVWFFTVFLCVFFFSRVYSARQGQTTHWGQKLYDNKKACSLCPYVASFKMISSKSDFIHIFNDFIHVYSPRAKAGNPFPWGQNFDVNRKPLSLRPFVASFKQISLNSDFIHIF